MGSFSSGRSGWRRKVESQCAVDIRWMKRQGWIYDGSHSSISWSSRGEKIGNIDYKVSGDLLTLMYKSRKNGGDWEPVDVDITLDYTRCNYGSSRIWMRCPHCYRRCAIVYLADKYPACRKCYDLAYYSEAESHLDRFMRKARKSQEKLGYKDGRLDKWLPKPKGMHWKTYERHLKVIKAANDCFSCEVQRLFNLSGER